MASPQCQASCSTKYTLLYPSSSMLRIDTISYYLIWVCRRLGVGLYPTPGFKLSTFCSAAFWIRLLMHSGSRLTRMTNLTYLHLCFKLISSHGFHVQCQINQTLVFSSFLGFQTNIYVVDWKFNSMCTDKKFWVQVARPQGLSLSDTVQGTSVLHHCETIRFFSNSNLMVRNARGYSYRKYCSNSHWRRDIGQWS